MERDNEVVKELAVWIANFFADKGHPHVAADLRDEGEILEVAISAFLSKHDLTIEVYADETPKKEDS